MRVLVLMLALMFGQTTEQVCSVANACLANVELGKGAECHGPDLKHLTCSGLVITYKPQNVEIHVIPSAN